MINPKHYKTGKLQPIDVIEDLDFHTHGFSLSNIIKYLARLGKKDPALQEVSKALWYADRVFLYLEEIPTKKTHKYTANQIILDWNINNELAPILTEMYSKDGKIQVIKSYVQEMYDRILAEEYKGIK